MDAVHRSGNIVGVAGWAIDPDTTDVVQVDLFVDGRLAACGVTGETRSDVATAYPDYGTERGYQLTAEVGLGSHRLCAYALDSGPDRYNNPLLRCVDI